MRKIDSARPDQAPARGSADVRYTATSCNAPIDGDRERPLEKLTRGAYSRRQIDRELSYYVQVGRVALVHQPMKGSTLQPKVRWAVAWSMEREVPTWRCPYTGFTFRSKSFTAFELNQRMNYMQFLGLPPRKTIADKLKLPMEELGRIDVHLPEPRPAVVGAQLPIIKIKTANENDVKEVTVVESPAAKPTKISHLQQGPTKDGQSTVITNNDGRKLAEVAQPELMELMDEESAGAGHDMVSAPHRRDKQFGVQSRIRTHNWECENGCGFDASTEAEVEYHELRCDYELETADTELGAERTQMTSTQSTKPMTGSSGSRSRAYSQCDGRNLDMGHISLGTNEDADNIESMLAEKESHKTQINESFDTICRKRHKIPFEFIDAYHKWLLRLEKPDGTKRFTPDDLPRSRRSVTPDMKVPPPYGPLWQQVLDEKGLKWSMKYQAT